MKASGEVLVQVGKNGITDNTFLEVIKNINKGNPVRVKFLKSSLEESDRFKSAESILAAVIKKAHVRSRLVGNILYIEPLKRKANI